MSSLSDLFCINSGREKILKFYSSLVKHGVASDNTKYRILSSRSPFPYGE